MNMPTPRRGRPPQSWDDAVYSGRVNEYYNGLGSGQMSYPEVEMLVKVLGLLHPGANAEWQFSNDEGELQSHLGYTSVTLQATWTLL